VCMRNLTTVPFLILALAGMSLMGLQLQCIFPCQDADGDGYGRYPAQDCPVPDFLDCYDDISDDPPICPTCDCGEPECSACARCVNPGVKEGPDEVTCYDGMDNDCDGLVDREDEGCALLSECLVEPLVGGDYSFTITNSDDGCSLFVLLQTLGLIPLGPYPIQLPGHNELPTDTTVTLPFLGTVAGTLSLDGDVIRLSVPEEIVVEDFVIPGIGSIDMAFTVSGALCPLAQEQVEAEITGTLIRIVPPIVSPCTANISMTGALQGG
jgi:hypothetical protein